MLLRVFPLAVLELIEVRRWCARVLDVPRRVVESLECSRFLGVTQFRFFDRVLLNYGQIRLIWGLLKKLTTNDDEQTNDKQTNQVRANPAQLGFN